MNTKKTVRNSLKIALPLILGGAILYWMYRDFDFSSISDVLLHDMDWTWMILSFPFGILAMVFRGLRWRQTLRPVGEDARASVCVNSIFLSYAVSLIIPRVGEFARCGVLTKHEHTDFAKALGTVVTERAVDMVLMLIMTAAALLLQVKVFGSFFSKTGTRLDDILNTFSTTGWIVTIVCGIAAVALIYILLRQLSFYNRIKEAVHNIWLGIISIKDVDSVPMFLFYSIGIWVCYFLHFYLTFFCFDFTSHLGITCATVCFVVGTIAVIVPTPNGAGPWHFSVKTMLALYGVAATNALYFVLIVHTVQTLLIVVMGVYAWIRLAFISPADKTAAGTTDATAAATATERKKN